MFLWQTSVGVMAMAGSLAMIVIVLWRDTDWALLPRGLFLGALVSMGVTGGAEVLAAWTIWRHDRNSLEDVRREGDFVLGGYRAASRWRRVRNYSLTMFLVLCGVLVFVFGRQVAATKNGGVPAHDRHARVAGSAIRIPGPLREGRQ